MQVAITKMSSRGQVVIPAEMREDIAEGEKLIVFKKDHQIIMKKTDTLDENFEKDLEFARQTEEAWKKYERGEFVEMDFDEFIKKMKTW